MQSLDNNSHQITKIPSYLGKYHHDEYYNPYTSYRENLFRQYSVAETANSHVQDKTCMYNEQNIPTYFNLSHETLTFPRAQTNNILTQNMYIINPDGFHLFPFFPLRNKLIY